MSSTAIATSPYPGSTSLTTSNPKLTALSTSTPQRIPQSIPRTPAIAPSPGQFQHPRIAEIVKRRAATAFTEKNVQTIALNVVALLGSFIARDYIQKIFALIASTTTLDRISSLSDVTLILNAIRLILCFNIFLASRPLMPYFDKPDLIEDIPLTPSQRALVGLPPSSRSSRTPQSVPGSGYTTPTRYRHTSPSSASSTQQRDFSATSTGRRSISANYSPSSPLSLSSFSPAPLSQSQQRGTGSPFSPSSPLLHKALDQGGSLRRSQSLRERLRKQPDPATPSPNARERTKVQAGLNYKWIYERGLKVKDDGSVDY